MSESREEPLLGLEGKVEIAEAVLKDAFRNFIRPGILVNADRDGIVLLHLIKTVSEKQGSRMPPVLFIDHGDHFPETFEEIDKLSKEWNFRALTVKNEDVLNAIKEGKLSIEDLSDVNRDIIKKSGFSNSEIVASLENSTFSYLVKNVPLYASIEKYRFDSIITTIDSSIMEEDQEVHFMFAHSDPSFSIIIPALTFTAADHWKYTFDKKLSVHPKYKEGYSSVDHKSGNETKKEKPPWESILGDSAERSGSPEDKEKLMEKLRALGYM